MTATTISREPGGPLPALSDLAFDSSNPYSDAGPEPDVWWGENGIDALSAPDGRSYIFPPVDAGAGDD